MSRLPALLFLCLAVGGLIAQAAPPSSPPTPIPTQDEVARLIRQLGDDDYDRREEATRLLKSLGPAVWPALRRTMKADGDAEMRSRCARILDAGQRMFAPMTPLRNHTQQVNTLAISADGQRLLSGGLDFRVTLWNPATDEKIITYTNLGGVWAVALSRDGKRCLTDGNDRVKDNNHAICVCDHNLNEVRRLVGHTDEVRTLVFLPDGKRALSAGLDRTIRLWDVDTGKELRKFVGHSDAIRRLALSADGKQVLSCSKDHTVRCWNVDTGEELSRFIEHQGDVLNVAYVPDGKRAVSVGADKIARLWVIATGQEVRRFEGHTRCLWGVAVSPDGRWLLTSSGMAPRLALAYVPAPDDHDIRLWDLASGVEMHRFTDYTCGISAVLFAPDGKMILAASSDTLIRRWHFGIPPAR